MAVKRQSAGARAKAQGRRLVWATFAGAEHDLIRAAAGMAQLPMSAFVQGAALREAERVVRAGAADVLKQYQKVKTATP